MTDISHFSDLTYLTTDSSEPLFKTIYGFTIAWDDGVEDIAKNRQKNLTRNDTFYLTTEAVIKELQGIAESYMPGGINYVSPYEDVEEDTWSEYRWNSNELEFKEQLQVFTWNGQYDVSSQKYVNVLRRRLIYTISSYCLLEK